MARLFAARRLLTLDVGGFREKPNEAASLRTCPGGIRHHWLTWS